MDEDPVMPTTLVVQSFVDVASRAANLAHPAELLTEYHHRGRSQRGTLNGPDGEWRYYLHGIGCRYVAPDGIEVDVDISTVDGRPPIFDRWRVAGHARSIAAEEPSEAAFVAACTKLVGDGVLEVDGSSHHKQAWFVIPTLRESASR